MAPAARREPSWADLPPELVEAILMLLPLEDYSAVGLACKQWRAAMINARSLFKPPPVLILARSFFEPPHDLTRFYSICGGGEHRDIPMIRPIPIPGVPDTRPGRIRRCRGVPATRHGRVRRYRRRVKATAKAKSTAPAARCCGSWMGWLFMVDVNDQSSVHLLNPVSAEKVSLPALPPHITLLVEGDVLCSKPASDPDCIVAVIGSMVSGLRSPVHLSVLLTCRPKDDEWIQIPYISWVFTFAFYEARLYVIYLKGMDIYNFDPYPTKIPPVVRRTMDLPYRATPLLAVMDGKLLCVHCDLPGPCCVYEFVDDCLWMKIQSLGEWALVLSRFTSQAFSTKESPTLGFRANYIYQASAANMHIHVYSMEDDSFFIIPPPLPDAAYWFLAQSWWVLEMDSTEGTNGFNKWI